MTAGEWSVRVLGHFLHWGSKWQHVTRYTQVGPAAVSRRTLCGLKRAVIVDRDSVDPNTKQLVPVLAEMFLHWYSNGWPDFTDPVEFDQDIWCTRCRDQYQRQRARALA